MGLLDEHKSERRARILASARQQLAKHGYDGLTMRDLAQAARVSVPTLYNLFGGKDAILAAAMAESVERVASLAVPADVSFFGRARIGFDAGMAMIADAPEFYRKLIPLFMTSPDAQPIRHRTELGFVALMTANLMAAREARQLAEWADPRVVAGHMWAQYMAAFLHWGTGGCSLEDFRTIALSGICHLLLGAARGRFAEEVSATLRELAPHMAALADATSRTQEPHHARTRSADSD
ncbi:MAG TPA: TetR/AcrR family transcriptional regulator [Kofleriaceae bacterium]|nr:TetR/AcrR family transcriptional regulator [Kofleriaceae bacterium]